MIQREIIICAILLTIYYFVQAPVPPGQNVLFQGFGTAAPSCPSDAPESTRAGNTHMNILMFHVCNIQFWLTDLFERFANHLGDGV